MSRANVELVRRGTEALNHAFKTGEFRDALETLCDPEIVLTPSGIFPESSVMRGHRGMLRFVSIQTEGLDDFWVEPRTFIDAGDHVVVPLRFGGRARHTGLDVAFDVVYVLTAGNGRWTRIDMYASEAEALKAVGLEE